MNDNDLKRISRLTAILTQLQTKRIVTATALADKFEVSVRTIYRDIRTLEQAGVPVFSEEGKGYSLMEGYRLPPIMFTETEANALIIAEKLVLRSKDSSLVKEFSEAINKIKAVLSYPNKEKAELLSKRVSVGRGYEKNRTSENLTSIQMALTNFNPIKLHYESKVNEVTTRIIEPFALYNSEEEDWTLAAYCRLRKDFRSFRLDRMQKIEILEEKFEPHKITLEQYVAKFIQTDFPSQ